MSFERPLVLSKSVLVSNILAAYVILRRWLNLLIYWDIVKRRVVETARFDNYGCTSLNLRNVKTEFRG